MPEARRVSALSQKLNYAPNAISKILNDFRYTMINTKDFISCDNDQIRDVTKEFLAKFGSKLWPKDRTPSWPAQETLISEAVSDILQVQRRNQFDLARKRRKRNRRRQQNVETADTDDDLNDPDFIPDQSPNYYVFEETRVNTTFETTESGPTISNSRQDPNIEDENATIYPALTQPPTVWADANAGVKQTDSDVTGAEEDGYVHQDKRPATWTVPTTRAFSVPVAGAHDFHTVEAASTNHIRTPHVSVPDPEASKGSLPQEQDVQTTTSANQPHTTVPVETVVQAQTQSLHSATQIISAHVEWTAFNKIYEIDPARFEDLVTVTMKCMDKFEEARKRAFSRTRRQDLSPEQRFDAEVKFSILQEARSDIEKEIVEKAGARLIYD